MIFNVCAGAPILPIGKFTYNGTEYTFDGQTTLEVSGVFKYQPDSAVTGGWRMWVYQSCTIDFNAFPRSAATEYCAIGRGASAGSGSSYTDGSTVWDWGAPGGSGGMHSTAEFVATETLTISISATGTILSNGSTEIVNLGVGGGASGGRGGCAIAYESGSHAVPYDADSGSNGSLAFNGETNSVGATFDSVKYAPGGGGGGTWWSPSSARGAGSDNGSPGTAGGANSTATNGCVLFWCKGLAG